jgi:hypothetical protein
MLAAHLRTVLLLAAMAIASGSTEALASAITGTSLVSEEFGTYSMFVPDSSTGTVTGPINATVTGSIDKLDSSGEFAVDVGDPSRIFRYAFTVSLTNSTAITSPTAIGKVQFDLLSPSGGVDLGNDVFSQPSGASASYDTTVTFTGPATKPTGIIFDATSAGLGVGDTGTYNFVLTVNGINALPTTGFTGSFNFKVTATPEPTSLVLGALLMTAVGGGGLFQRWRRRQTAPAPAA